MELQEIYTKFREIAEELHKKHNIQIERVTFDWRRITIMESYLVNMDIDTTKQGR